MLLGAVVQVALDPLALGVRRGDQPAARGLQVRVRPPQVGQRGLQGLVQAAVAEHDRQPAGDLGERPVVGRAERQRVRRPLDDHQRQDAAAVQGRREPQLPVGQRTRVLVAVEQTGHPQPQPARPGHAHTAQHAQFGRLERGRHGVGVGVQRAGHDERAVQARVGTPRPGRGGVVEAGPHLDPGELPVAAHRLGEGAQQVVDGAAAAGVLGEVGEQLVGRAAHRVHRGAGPAGGPAGERTGTRRRDHDRDHGGPDDPALGARRAAGRAGAATRPARAGSPRRPP